VGLDNAKGIDSLFKGIITKLPKPKEGYKCPGIGRSKGTSQI
jgi:hypothetical protein